MRSGLRVPSYTSSRMVWPKPRVPRELNGTSGSSASALSCSSMPGTNFATVFRLGRPSLGSFGILGSGTCQSGRTLLIMPQEQSTRLRAAKSRADKTRIMGAVYRCGQDGGTRYDGKRLSSPCAHFLLRAHPPPRLRQQGRGGIRPPLLHPRRFWPRPFHTPSAPRQRTPGGWPAGG